METLTLQDLIKAGMAKELALKSRKMETSQIETKDLEEKATRERTPGVLPISSIQRKIINEQADQDSDDGLTLDSDSDFEYDLN